MQSHDTNNFQDIPVIDVAPLFSDDRRALDSVAQAIRKASIEVGFFYVSGHNVGKNLMRATVMASKYFFALPDEVKRRIAINSAHRGYVGFAQTTLRGAKKADLKESFNFAFPFPENAPELKAGRPLVGPNQWPAGEAMWQSVLEDYYQQVFELGQRILKAIAVALELPQDFFRKLYQRPLVRARLLHYPPQTENDDDQYGAAEHTDYGTITLLWQDDVGGLQVKNRQGVWIDAPYLEDSFVVNIGDMLARWSNDLFVSTPHRVMNKSGRERYSIPVFYDPDFDVAVACLPNCSSADNPPRYPPITAGEYITGRYDGSYAYRQKEPA